MINFESCDPVAVALCRLTVISKWLNMLRHNLLYRPVLTGSLSISCTTVKLELQLWCIKRKTYIERPTHPLVEKEDQFLNKYKSRREHKFSSSILKRLETGITAGESQKQFNNCPESLQFGGWQLKVVPADASNVTEDTAICVTVISEMISEM